jgi:hypothetical protein
VKEFPRIKLNLDFDFWLENLRKNLGDRMDDLEQLLLLELCPNFMDFVLTKETTPLYKLGK